MFKKPIVLDLYTDRPDVYHYSQWQYAAKNKPKWWKGLPKSLTPTIDNPWGATNMKHCAGFNDLYANSFLMPMWSDLLVEIAPEDQHGYRYQFADGQGQVLFHEQHQRGDWMPEDKYQHLKLNSPWVAKCTHDIGFLFTTAEYEQSHTFDFHVINGVVNYGSIHGSDLNVAYKRDAIKSEKLIEKDQILAMIVPITERKVTLRHHLVTTDELGRLGMALNPHLWFKNGFKKAKKCPFHTK